jgi:hypothetical protein
MSALIARSRETALSAGILRVSQSRMKERQNQWKEFSELTAPHRISWLQEVYWITVRWR